MGRLLSNSTLAPFFSEDYEYFMEREFIDANGNYFRPDRLAYGPLPIVLVLSIHYYAYAYLLVSAALRSINSELEEMGEIVGASKGLMLRKITFPLVLPAILSSVILTFSKV